MLLANLCSCFVECLGEVSENVVDVFDAHAESNHFWCDAHLLLFFGRQLPVSGGRGMARERLGVAHIHHALE